MAIACLRVPHLALRIALLDQPELDGHPLILSNPESGRAVVTDATSEATERGIRAGMTLREANALCPDAVILMPHPAMETRVSQDILTRLEEISPLVEADEDEQGAWYIDLAGLERHFPTTKVATERLVACIPPILRPRAGLATNRFTARAAADIAPTGGIQAVPTGMERRFLKEAPVTLLPFPPEMTHQLSRLGLTTLGAVATLPAAKLAARFGPDGRLARELAAGIDPRKVTPRPYAETIIEKLAMPSPVISHEMLMIGLRQLVQRAFNRPSLKNRQVREVILRAVLENRRSWERTLILKAPCGASGLITALDLRLQALEMPGPIESISLQLGGIVNEIGHQQMLPSIRPHTTRPVTEAIRHLKQRYGLSPLFHVVEMEPWSRIPERRHALIAYEP
ncbi:MAG TPA: DNA polymerase Y family protein [Thermomicrobiales bacterium]|nr:DNA polymerase Y family protein [Thermomicrobiales bacterium]